MVQRSATATPTAGCRDTFARGVHIAACGFPHRLVRVHNVYDRRYHRHCEHAGTIFFLRGTGDPSSNSAAASAGSSVRRDMADQVAEVDDVDLIAEDGFELRMLSDLTAGRTGNAFLDSAVALPSTTDCVRLEGLALSRTCTAVQARCVCGV